LLGSKKVAYRTKLRDPLMYKNSSLDWDYWTCYYCYKTYIFKVASQCHLQNS